MGAADGRAVRQPQRPLRRQPASGEPTSEAQLLPGPGQHVLVYYGRLFLPTNVEDLRAITSDAQGGVVAAPTLPERHDFYEVGYVPRLPLGAVTKLPA